jgi:uncharacterized protein
MRLRTAPLAIALLFAATKCFAASFDCSRARTQVEKLICADPLLGRLDDTLALNYRAMLTVDVGQSKQSLRAEQLGWLSRRNQCKDSHCLVEAYRVRIDETCEYGVVSHIGHPSVRALDSTLRVLGYSKGALSLKDQGAQRTIVYVRTP